MPAIPAIVGLAFVVGLAVVTVVLCYFAFVVPPRQPPEVGDAAEVG